MLGLRPRPPQFDGVGRLQLFDPPAVVALHGRRIKELEAAHAIELRRARSEAEHLRQQCDALQQSNAYYEQRGSGGCAVDVVPRASFAARGCMASVTNNIDRLMNIELPFNSR